LLQVLVVKRLLLRVEQARPRCGQLIQDCLRCLAIGAVLEGGHLQHLPLRGRADHVRVCLERGDS
jgi:hypothetical protein